MSSANNHRTAEEIKSDIFRLTEEFYLEKFSKTKFTPGETEIPISGKVFDHSELQFLIDASLDGCFTTGRFNDQFENELSKFINIRAVTTVNSGSSANLLATACLFADELEERKIKAGDEVITVAVSFPTTLNTWLMYGVTPVFVDVEIPTYNIDITKVESAISEKTKAIMLAHTLGNPFNIDAIKEISRKYKLWLIEDSCDALGSKYNGKHVGTFGDVSTLSFYPAHHITMGEGGVIFTSNPKLNKIIKSLRDWGRDCWCDPGKNNTCGKRFDWELGGLPHGYDHKYIYSHLGYNLKITDMQAALGLAQLKKLPGFIQHRRRNFDRLKKGLSDFQHKLILPEPTKNSEPSWFGFLITVRDDAGISRNDLIYKLTQNKIATRLLFGGDIRKQPYFINHQYRTVGGMKNTETILSNTFWIGVTPMITDEMVDYVVETFGKILNE